MQKKKYPAAIKHLDNCIKKEDKNPEYFYLRGKCKYSTGRRTEGVDDVSRAVKLAPDTFRYRITRAAMYENLGQCEKAIPELYDALVLAKNAKDSSKVYTNQGLCIQNQGDTAGGIRVLEAALRLDSTNTDAMNNLALALYNTKDRLDESIVLLEMIISIDSLDATAWMNLGYTYSLKGEFEKAIVYYNKSLSLYPYEPLTYNNRGYAKLKTGDLNGALADVQRSLAMFPQNSFGYRNLGLIYLAKGDQEKACAAFDKALYWGFTKLYGPEVMRLKKENCK